ncbi:Hypothetical protein DEACI_2437 [Acididesulfobacillus acetoxydans]|uniref:Uncharacterized protein n=1 Tax=Acididesulfobacillus acetoxydans TaxID=1561005 RepID=A0A8S0W8D9_9FIRM|nr:Hypothetical protein DEACI_2437 [Acididesulfobacillus acetoxydans]CEJ09012.1 Hypothetical protein DEACI_3494 [Acididesulfobacillus acetoxydans]
MRDGKSKKTKERLKKFGICATLKEDQWNIEREPKELG